MGRVVKDKLMEIITYKNELIEERGSVFLFKRP